VILAALLRLAPTYSPLDMGPKRCERVWTGCDNCYAPTYSGADVRGRLDVTIRVPHHRRQGYVPSPFHAESFRLEYPGIELDHDVADIGNAADQA